MVTEEKISFINVCLQIEAMPEFAFLKICMGGRGWKGICLGFENYRFKFTIFPAQSDLK